MSANINDAEALRRMREVWEWAIKAKRPVFAYLLGMAIIAFDMDHGTSGGFSLPPSAVSARIEARRPRRGRPPKKRE
jgi:hypothetical protein